MTLLPWGLNTRDELNGGVDISVGGKPKKKWFSSSSKMMNFLWYTYSLSSNHVVMYFRFIHHDLYHWRYNKVAYFCFYLLFRPSFLEVDWRGFFPSTTFSHSFCQVFTVINLSPSQRLIAESQINVKKVDISWHYLIQQQRNTKRDIKSLLRFFYWGLHKE